ncbi:MAG: GntR family transcriptional regulator [Bacillota bacterium]|nr:MAG: GntR family transcriptional regulator [Bacillota bacterium]
MVPKVILCYYIQTKYVIGEVQLWQNAFLALRARLDSLRSCVRAKPVKWHINPHSGVPIYVQLVQQVKTAIAAGVLREGDRLPTVRELALELTINPNTVARAYRELERAGFIETTPGRGTYVKAAKHPPMPAEERRRRLATVVEVMVAEARALGFTDEEILETVRAAVAGQAGNGGSA